MAIPAQERIADLLSLARAVEVADAKRLRDLEAAAQNLDSVSGLAQVLRLSGDLLYEHGDFAAAAEAFQGAVELPGEPAGVRLESLLSLGLCLNHQGLHDEASRCDREVIDSPLASAEQVAAARRNLVYAEGVRRFAEADFAAAHACFAKALTLHPGDDDFRSDILMWLGACHGQLGQYAAARDAYQDLVVNRSTHVAVRGQAAVWKEFAEGQVLFTERDYQQARQKFEGILARRPAANEFLSGVRLMLAHCLFHLREYTQAGRNYRHILKTRNASREQKAEARRWRGAIPGIVERLTRAFGRHWNWLAR